jgi:hypothetical protein
MLVAVIIFLLALLASSVAWANRSHHGHGFKHGHGLTHHGFRHDGHRARGHSHTRGRVEIIIGAPLHGSWHYRAHPHYYGQHTIYAYPPVIATPAAPPVYIERGDPDDSNSLQQPRAYWYYCSNPQGYYPYVSNCPLGWQQQPAQPPPDLK